MPHHPRPIVPVGHVEPCPRRVRAHLGDVTVLDTSLAFYLFEWPFYPQWYVRPGDVHGSLTGTGRYEDTAWGRLEWLDLAVGGDVVRDAARRLTQARDPRVDGHLRFSWDAVDRWFEEDEPVDVHPRNPYVRVDAVRSRRSVRIELAGTVLAASDAPVLVFETGLPTRAYLDPTAVRFDRLVRSDAVTRCPYKGTTSGYWSAAIDGAAVPDVAWTYAHPVGAVSSIAGLVAFYDEVLDVYFDGSLQDRPRTHLRS